jgi:hypothetical protein
MRGWFRRQVLGRRWLCFVVLVFAFLGFGAGTLNLFFALRANVALLADHGWQAVMDGGGQQAIEIVLSGVASMACYIVFKSCEYRLVQLLAGKEIPES